MIGHRGSSFARQVLIPSYFPAEFSGAATIARGQRTEGSTGNNGDSSLRQPCAGSLSLWPDLDFDQAPVVFRHRHDARVRAIGEKKSKQKLPGLTILLLFE